jgi:hypothetical protein
LIISDSFNLQKENLWHLRGCVFHCHSTKERQED